MKLILIALITVVLGAVSHDQSSLVSAAKKIADKAMSNYVPSATGAFLKDNEDGQNVQWFESGVIWAAFIEHIKATGDTKWLDQVTQSLVNASYGVSANFLGSPSIQALSGTLEGKWNDDILWYHYSN
jgi:hypothetical protein